MSFEMQSAILNSLLCDKTCYKFRQQFKLIHVSKYASWECKILNIDLVIIDVTEPVIRHLTHW